MIKITKTFLALVALAACAMLIGCSSTPTEETKPVQAGDGSQKPTAAGATAAGGGGATGNAAPAGVATPK